MQHHATRAHIGVATIESIKTISNTITPLIAFRNKGAPHRREVRAILVRYLGIGTALMRFPATTTVTYRTDK